MQLKRYCVTAGSNPMRFFWTFDGAWKYWKTIPIHAFLYIWNPTQKEWQESIPSKIYKKSIKQRGYPFD